MLFAIGDADYRSIPSLNHEYYVDEFGNMMKLIDNQPKDIRTTVTSDGTTYKVVVNAYFSGGKRRYTNVSRLVAEVFLPDFDPDKYVYHKDEDSTNNHISNLYQKG